MIFKVLSIAALYCRQSEFCFRHFAYGLPPPIAHLELLETISVCQVLYVPLMLWAEFLSQLHHLLSPKQETFTHTLHFLELRTALNVLIYTLIYKLINQSIITTCLTTHNQSIWVSTLTNMDKVFWGHGSGCSERCDLWLPLIHRLCQKTHTKLNDYSVFNKTIVKIYQFAKPREKLCLFPRTCWKVIRSAVTV